MSFFSHGMEVLLAVGCATPLGAEPLTVTLDGVESGTVTLTCREPRDWRFDVVREKSADGTGTMVRGNYYVGGVLYEDVVLIDGKSVYSLDGKLIGFVDN